MQETWHWNWKEENTTVNEGILFFFLLLFGNMEANNVHIIGKHFNGDFYQNNQHDRSKYQPKQTDILRLLLLAPAGRRKRADLL